jgi:hypothetical protein
MERKMEKKSKGVYKIMGPKRKIKKESDVIKQVRNEKTNGLGMVCCKCKHFRSSPGRCLKDQSYHARKSVGCMAWENKGG